MLNLKKPKRGLPKTGQTVSYIPADDGAKESGWDHGNRFTVKTIDGDEVVIDHATGLMWIRDWSGPLANWGNPVTSWNAAFTIVAALTFADRNDWRIPNINELFTLSDLSLVGSIVPAIFTNVPVGKIWSSTTHAIDNLNAYHYDTAEAIIKKYLKTTTTYYSIAVRNI